MLTWLITPQFHSPPPIFFHVMSKIIQKKAYTFQMFSRVGTVMFHQWNVNKMTCDRFWEILGTFLETVGGAQSPLLSFLSWLCFKGRQDYSNSILGHEGQCLDGDVERQNNQGL